MPRAGLDGATVVAGAAALADEIGFEQLTMGRLAERFGVRTPSLYKHVASQADLNRQVALLALEELSDLLDAALAGRSGKDALVAATGVIRGYVTAHPGRWAATVRLDLLGPDDPLVAAQTRGLASLGAVLTGYGLDPADEIHALRVLRSLFHGFAVIEAAGGFQLAEDVDASFTWLVDFVDGGLRSRAGQPAEAKAKARSRPSS